MDKQKLRDRLAELVAEVGEKNVWRPVADDTGRVLSQGIGLPDDGLPKDLADLDFAGKRVADLGCNFGTYTLHAAARGAALALGVDAHPGVIEGARILAKLKGLENTRFEVSDFLAEPPVAVCDMALMVDIIGKKIIAKGKLDACLSAMAAYAESEMVFTFRPVYKLTALKADADALRRLYPSAPLRDNAFHLAEYAQLFFGPEWRVEIDAPDGDLTRKYKYLVRFTR